MRDLRIRLAQCNHYHQCHIARSPETSQIMTEGNGASSYLKVDIILSFIYLEGLLYPWHWQSTGAIHPNSHRRHVKPTLNTVVNGTTFSNMPEPIFTKNNGRLINGHVALDSITKRVWISRRRIKLQQCIQKNTKSATVRAQTIFTALEPPPRTSYTVILGFD